MGNKIITEKDFWMCTGGNMPAPMQVQQPIAKKKSGDKFVTKIDTSTSSIIDFGCKKLMLIMAIVAAVIAVCVVATGGAALIAVAAAAGAAGAALGAIVGGLICGQVAALARKWLDSKDKPNKGFYILDQPAITGDHKMKCMLFGDEITFAPEIKNWWQALAVGGANLITGIMEGMMYGAMVGMGGAALSGVRTLISQGGVQLSRQAGLNFFKTNGVNVLKNLGSGIFGDWGMKAADGAVGFLNKYGYTGSANASDFTDAVKESAMGDITAIKNAFSGNGSLDDFMALAMLFAPGGKPKKGDASSSTHADANSPKKSDGTYPSSKKSDSTDPSSKKSDGTDPNSKKDADDGTVHKSHTPDAGAPAKPKEGEAYEAPKKKAPDYDDLATKEPCFLAGTMVKTINGEKEIETIKVDDMVFSFNFAMGAVEEKNVMQTFTNWTNKYYQIKTNGKTIDATSKHLFWVVSENKWIPAKELKPQMVFLSIGKKELLIEEIILVKNVDLLTYNFEVQDLNNYFVCSNGVLVHNQNKPSSFESTTKQNVEFYKVTNAKGETVYIGQTIQGIDKRFGQHQAEGKKKDNYKKDWGDPDKFNIEPIDISKKGPLTPYEAHAWEKHLIDKAKSEGQPLKNKANPIGNKKYDKFADLHNPC